MEVLQKGKHFKIMGDWILTYDNKRFKVGSPEFKKWCKDQKFKLEKIKVNSIVQKSKTPKIKLSKPSKRVKREKSIHSSNSNQHTSVGLLLLTILPMVLVMIMAILSALGVIQPIAEGISRSSESMFENFEFLYLCREVIVDWMNSLEGGWSLLLFPIVILAFILGFVLDIVLGLLYLLVAALLFLISIIFGFIFVYVLCPGVVILEIIMIQKSFKDTYSITNKGWSITSLFLSLIFTIIFYICFINIR